MKEPDLYYFEAINRRHKPSQILYGECEPQGYTAQVAKLKCMYCSF